MSIRRDQLAIIHIAKKDLKLDDDLYRTILQQAAGVASSRDLNQQSFENVMKRLKQLGYKNAASDKSAKAAKDGSALVLPGQMRKMEELYNKVGWDEPERQRGFNQRQIKKPWPQTRTEANKIIEGLKSISNRL